MGVASLLSPLDNLFSVDVEGEFCAINYCDMQRLSDDREDESRRNTVAAGLKDHHEYKDPQESVEAIKQIMLNACVAGAKGGVVVQNNWQYTAARAATVEFRRLNGLTNEKNPMHLIDMGSAYWIV